MRRTPRCGACGEFGHYATRGQCSPAYRAERLMRERGLSVEDAARSVGMAPCDLRKRVMGRPPTAVVEPAVDEHW